MSTTKTDAQYTTEKILRCLKTNAANFRSQVEGLRDGDKVKIQPITLEGLTEAVPNNPSNALLYMAEYAVAALDGLTAEEIDASENLTFLCYVASYGGSVGLKNALTAETSADRSTKRAKVVRSFADTFAEVTAKLFGK
jgi:hypothetical protein